jgi:hypothetical protein
LKLNLQRAQSLLELSQNHYLEARALVSQALRSITGDDARLHSDLTSILGLTYTGVQEFGRGVQLCRESLQEAERTGLPVTRLRASLALGQALLQAGNRAAALGALRNAEPDSAKYPEARWRLMALMAQADPEYTVPARAALNALEQLWGLEAVQRYMASPDIQQVSRPLFGPSNATHQ